MYKIVDTFNGYSSQVYERQEEAETQLIHNRKEFFAHPGHGNAKFCQVIMDSKVTWGWNERLNKFCWE